MEAYKREFIQFLEGAGVLKFGDFTAKSGRKIPYFVNAGMIKTGDQITKMGEFYAKAYFDKLGKKVTDYFLAHTKVDQKAFKKKAPSDWYFDEQDMLENGLIDEIITDVLDKYADNPIFENIQLYKIRDFVKRLYNENENRGIYR